MPDLTPLEAAEKLESLVDYAGDTLDDALEFNLRKTVDAAASLLRREYKPVIHAHWIEDGDTQICSNCGEEHEWFDYRATYCDVCGALMDGKEDKR